VYEALEDYKDELAEDEIQGMGCEEDCWEYQEKIEEMETFFQTDLFSIIWRTKARINILLESGGDDEGDDRSGGPVSADELNDQEILRAYPQIRRMGIARQIFRQTRRFSAGGLSPARPARSGKEKRRSMTENMAARHVRFICG